ncbi:uncharacterized protein LOC122858188 [Aphidius gifuensis]|uniref:uncharacterized protein LOC122858188 n=1 Tax=Aphidius gifuensis TaxID=684658 RepID=UPI001CDBF7DA|nr:uncharacterized protein LOC122858188 [Aphidius gifuensis]
MAFVIIQISQFLSCFVIIMMVMMVDGVDENSLQPYLPSGWRPTIRTPKIPAFIGTNNYNYTKPLASTTTTTQKSVTATTIPNEILQNDKKNNKDDENDFDTQAYPALAIANSFAFNRPIYVYTGHPYFQPYFK